MSSTNTILFLTFAGFASIFFFIVVPRLIPVLTKQKDTRQQAIKLGLTVEEVNEGAPTFSAQADPIRPVRNERIVRYSLKRIGSSPSYWSILPRLEIEGVAYPENWLEFDGLRCPPEMWFLVAKEDAPSECLKAFAKQIASAWTEEYLEFEGTPTEVRAYWHEWGGSKQARIVYDYLRALSQW